MLQKKRNNQNHLKRILSILCHQRNADKNHKIPIRIAKIKILITPNGDVVDSGKDQLRCSHTAVCAGV